LLLALIVDGRSRSIGEKSVARRSTASRHIHLAGRLLGSLSIAVVAVTYRAGARFRVGRITLLTSNSRICDSEESYNDKSCEKILHVQL
ncbi:hypothetical protein PFISCL1PPCAC_6995, partial [Pristionchus fissidentatus]